MNGSQMNKEQAAKFLGISVRTLQRHVQRGEIAVAYVRGKRGDEATFDETELARFKTTLERPAYVTRATGDSIPGAPSQAIARRIDAGSLAEYLSAILEQRREPPAVAISDKLMLTLAEAAQLAGLSRDHLRAAISEEKLKGRIIGRGFKVKRDDLEAYVRKL